MDGRDQEGGTGRRGRGRNDEALGLWLKREEPGEAREKLIGC